VATPATRAACYRGKYAHLGNVAYTPKRSLISNAMLQTVSGGVIVLKTVEHFKLDVVATLCTSKSSGLTQSRRRCPPPPKTTSSRLLSVRKCTREGGHVWVCWKDELCCYVQQEQETQKLYCSKSPGVIGISNSRSAE
jgi:hypothetical protein